MVRPVSLRLKNDDRAPTLGAMDMPLSFNTTMRFLCRSPALFNPSKARPAVRAPSPMTAITRLLSRFRQRPQAIPRAPEMEVELWPVSKES